MLNIKNAIENGKAVFSLEGRLDTVAAPDLEKAFAEVLPNVSELTLDLAELEYVSSAGLRVLLATQKTMQKQGGMKLINVGETIMDIFEVTGFTEILTIE